MTGYRRDTKVCVEVKMEISNWAIIGIGVGIGMGALVLPMLIWVLG